MKTQQLLHVTLRNGDSCQVKRLTLDEQLGHGFTYCGVYLGATHLWMDDGRWRENGEEHPFDIRQDSLPLQTA